LYFVQDDNGVNVNSCRASSEEMSASYWLPACAVLLIAVYIKPLFPAVK